MKKYNNRKGKLFVAAAAGVMTLGLLAGSISSFASPGRVGFVGEAKAKQIALSNSGLKEAEVTFVRTELELEKGNYEYEVEFYKGGVEHDYKIDAKTGRILGYDKDIENFTIPGSSTNAGNAANNGNATHATKNATENKGALNTAAISAEKAKELALKHAGLKAEEVKFIKVELDKEKGKNVYDVEFYQGNIEYDFELDSRTGLILSQDYDVENYTIPGTSVADTTMEKAKEVALKQAGVDASKAKFVKAEIDIEDGVLVYDIEFYVDNTEYDFEIDAKTGKVREFDKDIENFVIQKAANTKAENNTSPANTAALSIEKAKEAALKHAGLNANQVNFTKAKMDKDDGRAVYDIEFKVGADEYSFEIDPQSGKILDYDLDINDDRDDDRWDDRDDRQDRDYDDDDRYDDDDDDDEWDD